MCDVASGRLHLASQNRDGPLADGLYTLDRILPVSESDAVVLTADDYLGVLWQEIPGRVPEGRVGDFANEFYDQADAARERGSTREEAAYRLLGDLCSFRLALDSLANPFHPGFVTDAFQSAAPDAVSKPHIEALRALVPQVQDVRLRARMADFVWVQGRGYPAAEAAVDAYLEMARPLTEADVPWPEPLPHLERALQIALQLGRNAKPYERVSNFVSALLNQQGPYHPGFLSRQLLSLSAKHGLDDATELYTIAAGIADLADQASDWDRAERYWSVAVELAGREPEMLREARRRLGESYVGRARDSLSHPHLGEITAANFLQHAIEALRSAGGQRDRVNELHAEMIRYQREIPSKLVPIRNSIDISEYVTAARAAVADRPIGEALLVFALHPEVPSRARLRTDAEENAKRYVFKSLFPSVQLNNEGKVVARQGSSTSSDPAEREAALRADMLQNATHHHHLVGQAVVDPARVRIIEEHALRVDDFAFIVSNNPLVPGGRELLFAEAFYAGFVGDLTKAIHLVVHQLENSIRHLLARAGVVVTTVDKYGIQSERDLNSLLFEPKLEELLGPDVVFALQGLMVEKFGSNLRNKVAHGLMAHQEFFSYVALYLWWLCFRIVCAPSLNAMVREQGDPPAGEEG